MPIKAAHSPPILVQITRKQGRSRPKSGRCYKIFGQNDGIFGRKPLAARTMGKARGLCEFISCAHKELRPKGADDRLALVHKYCPVHHLRIPTEHSPEVRVRTKYNPRKVQLMTRRTFVRHAVQTASFPFALGCRRPNPEPDRTGPRVEWIQPSTTTSDAHWGMAGGLAVGLWPTEGPRGLIRIYTPYLGQSFPRMVNFIAIEPVVKGRRGQSELERGLKSGRRGLDFTTGDTPEEAAGGGSKPAAGIVHHVDGREELSFYLATEPFRNCARPVLKVMLRSDRPHEVGFQIHEAEGGKRMDSCVLTATMGNYGRLRRLWLKGEVVDARRAWNAPALDKLGFTPWRAWTRERLLRVGDRVVAAATTDEADPAAAAYEASVPAHWRLEGKPGTHYWRGPDVAGVVVRVNARPTYWGGGGPIPGGLAYENFELEAPFARGQEFWFGVTPRAPSALGFDEAWAANVTGG
jgi:hypothetical protein